MDQIGEAELISAGQSGAVLDGMKDGAKRAVPAAVLRSCCHELKDQVDPRGLRLANANVSGCLDLTGLAVPFPLRFDGCEFDAAPVVEGAELFELSLTGCPNLPGLLGNGLRLRRDLDLSRSQVAGAHWTGRSFGSLVALGALGTGVAYAMLATAAGRLDATRAAANNYIIPVVSLLLGVGVRHEQVSPVSIVGAAVCLTGAWLIKPSSVPHEPAPATQAAAS